MAENTTPLKLIVKLSIYFAVLISLIATIVVVRPDYLPYLPFGGSDVIERGSTEITESRLSIAAGANSMRGARQPTTDSVLKIIVFLAANLMATILVMLPVTWTYSATRYDSGPSKEFVRALLVLPICASTVVLLIQDSLALAFGLAALVAAVRFRVALREAIDGIYIFAAICVGLAAGIGYLGIAAIMAVFFCLTNATLWHMDYGRNPVEDARLLAKEAKRAKSGK